MLILLINLLVGRNGVKVTRLADFIPAERSCDDSTLVTILTYELGDIAKCLHYASIREGNERNAYLASARLGLCDLLTVSRQLAEKYNWDWSQLQYDGIERFKERMGDARGKMGS